MRIPFNVVYNSERESFTEIYIYNWDKDIGKQGIITCRINKMDYGNFTEARSML